MARRSESCDPFGDVDSYRALPSLMLRDAPHGSMPLNFVRT